MSKKKIALLGMAFMLTIICTVAGTLAWFTAQDDIKNIFHTGSVTPNDPDNPNINDGIVVDENFPDSEKNENGDSEYQPDVLPGHVVDKEVRVQNTASYDQLIRVKFEKVFTDLDGNIITSVYTLEDGSIVTAETEGATQYDLNLEYIILGFDDNLLPDGLWIQTTDVNEGHDRGYYYYNAIVEPQGYTDYLLDNVTLSKDADNYYKGIKFEVIVHAEAIQASNGAVSEVWTTAPEVIKTLGE